MNIPLFCRPVSCGFFVQLNGGDCMPYNEAVSSPYQVIEFRADVG
jgi:hypothetical protein